MAESLPDPSLFRRRFVNDRFVDIVAVHPGRRFKDEYEQEVREMFREGYKLCHYAIDSEYRSKETPDWVYTLFGLKRP